MQHGAVVPSTRPSLLFLSAALIASCGSEKTGDPDETGVVSFGANYGWTCSTGENCQDVFNFDVTAGSVLTIRVNDVSDGSVVQLALYGPAVPLGGINLLTGTTKELRCTLAASCSLFTGGEHVDQITVTQTGIYRIAVTREWGSSCGGSGTYRLQLTSTKGFQVVGQTVNDQVSQASGFECH